MQRRDWLLPKEKPVLCSVSATDGGDESMFGNDEGELIKEAEKRDQEKRKSNT